MAIFVLVYYKEAANFSELYVNKNPKIDFLNMQQEKSMIIAAQENAAKFKLLFDKYYNTIYNYALRRTCNIHTAEDIAANTFMKALNNIKKYKWKGISFSSWLYRIATNEIKLYYRKTNRLTSLTPDIEAQLKDDNKTDARLLEAEEILEKNEIFRQIHNTITMLKLKYQNVLTLRYFEEKSIKEIASILNLSENTVKTQIRRGLMQLRKQL